METNHTIDFIAIQDRPASARTSIHFVHALEAELNSRLSVTLGLPPIDVTSDVTELQLTESIPGELDVAGDFGVDEVGVSLGHRRDAPLAVMADRRNLRGSRLSARTGRDLSCLA